MAKWLRRQPGFVCCAMAAATAALSGFAAQAQNVEDFYRGKRLSFMVRGSPGGNSDLYVRLIAKYLPGHLPGQPQSVVQNMPGAAGQRMMGFVANVAPKDGTVIMNVPAFVPMEQALGWSKQADVDMLKLSWIGNMASENLFQITRGPSATKTLDDARSRETIMGVTGIEDSGNRILTIYNNLLGTRFRMVHGYPSGPELNLAMLRGEIEGRDLSNPHILLRNPDPALGKPAYNLLIQVGRKKDDRFPDVPLLKEMARTEEQQVVFDFISNNVALARPFAVADGVPPDRVAALREAFRLAMNDAALKAEADKLDLPLEFMSGEELQGLVAAIVNAPSRTIELTTAALKADPNNARARQTPKP